METPYFEPKRTTPFVAWDSDTSTRRGSKIGFDGSSRISFLAAVHHFSTPGHRTPVVLSRRPKPTAFVLNEVFVCVGGFDVLVLARHLIVAHRRRRQCQVR
jgi:hypothetical protein